MLRKVKDLKGLVLGARDGEIGRVIDCYFEDQNWAVRYLVADTSKWLPDRKVLLSPFAFAGINEKENLLLTNLTKEQIRNSPEMDEDKPVSRQYELQYYGYYNWPYYWQGAGLWGPASYPAYPTIPVRPDAGETGPSPSAPGSSGDPHLRSTEAIISYYIHAQDGDLGHVEDFVLEDDTWVIRYLVVDTRNWWPGKKVLIGSDWVSSIDWHNSVVKVDLSREVIKSAPELDLDQPITRDYETRLFRHYSRDPYWGERRHAA
jgi:hypothetical protein